MAAAQSPEYPFPASSAAASTYLAPNSSAGPSPGPPPHRPGPKAIVKATRIAALRGDRDAQFSLASAWDSGYGVPQDYARAAWWYQKAAAQGHLDALFSYAVLVEEGLGLPADPDKARALYLQGAEAGHPGSQNNLAIWLATHAAQSEDPEAAYKQAEQWFTRAAIRGHAEAQYNLARMYLSATGVAFNQDQARIWLRRAAPHYAPANALLAEIDQRTGTVKPPDPRSPVTPSER